MESWMDAIPEYMIDLPTHGEYAFSNKTVGLTERTCANCGKRIEYKAVFGWGYNQKRRGVEYMFCTYGCMRAWETGKGAEMDARSAARKAENLVKRREREDSTRGRRLTERLALLERRIEADRAALDGALDRPEQRYIQKRIYRDSAEADKIRERLGGLGHHVD